MLKVMQSLKERLHHVPQVGRLEWIGLRTQRRGKVVSAQRVEALPGRGLAGDHRAARDPVTPPSRRQVTLLQAEHLNVIAALTGREAVEPALLRRNLVVSGINLFALKNRQFYVGDVLLEATGPCHPCTRMDEALGNGGLSALRGHGGLTAAVVEGGMMSVGDAVRVKDEGL